MPQTFSAIDAMINSIEIILSNDRYPFSIEDRTALMNCILELKQMKLQDKKAATETALNIVNAMIRIFTMIDNFRDLL